MSDHYVITIERTFGSGGKTIGINLSEELGIPCYEDQLLRMASDYSGINERLFAQVDEKLRGSYITKMLAGFPNINRIAQPKDKNFVSDENLFKIQAEIIRQLASSESCIIIGKCGNLALKDHPNVVSVFVDADMNYCIENVKERLCVGDTEAERLILKTDKYRSDYYKYYSHGQEWKDPRGYDLSLNSGRIGMEKCAEAIKNFVNIKLGNVI
ncbi:MAG: cytidylate kinase-like family protein [Lachnospiraceae bacterium]|nr:cytidylate kinase-like family protein [Lachnospiraceae bacterium]